MARAAIARIPSTIFFAITNPLCIVATAGFLHASVRSNLALADAYGCRDRIECTAVRLKFASFSTPSRKGALRVSAWVAAQVLA